MYNLGFQYPPVNLGKLLLDPTSSMFLSGRGCKHKPCLQTRGTRTFIKFECDILLRQSKKCGHRLSPIPEPRYHPLNNELSTIPAFQNHIRGKGWAEFFKFKTKRKIWELRVSMIKGVPCAPVMYWLHVVITSSINSVDQTRGETSSGCKGTIRVDTKEMIYLHHCEKIPPDN